jgi:hypothetical protein
MTENEVALYVIITVAVILLLIPSPLSWFARRRLVRDHEREVEQYKTHLNTHMKVEHRGHQNITLENEQLKQQVGNLQITIRQLSRQPGQNDRRNLQIHRMAVELIYKRWPHFATTWAAAVGVAERHMQKAGNGDVPLTWPDEEEPVKELQKQEPAKLLKSNKK